ncbi:MAG: NAD(P)H-dependent oxidoreductase [Bacteroidota bacterium]|nr:NAD(P)H-dependent oxidoreductase [Bacteroidota bacterium]
MEKIVIISPSIRDGRNSHRVALYFLNLLKEKGFENAEILDLLKYNFPLFHERLENQKSPSPEAIEFSQKVRSADGVIIVTPEYNGGYPASLKNAVDLLVSEWYRKPIAFVPVSDGSFGGSQVIMSLQFSFWKLGAITVPFLLRLPDIDRTFDVTGVPVDKTSQDKRAGALIRELVKQIKAAKYITE